MHRYAIGGMRSRECASHPLMTDSTSLNIMVNYKVIVYVPLENAEEVKEVG